MIILVQCSASFEKSRGDAHAVANVDTTVNKDSLCSKLLGVNKAKALNHTKLLSFWTVLVELSSL